MWDEGRQVWVSKRTGKTYTAAQYEALSAIGKRAAAASKERAVIVNSQEYRDETDAMVRRLQESRGLMRPLPGRDGLRITEAAHFVEWTRRGLVRR